MRVTHHLQRATTAAALAALVAGCRGDAVAPIAMQSVSPSAAISGTGSPTSFTYDPRTATTFYLGGQHKISFAANAVCDPAVSTYGVTQWDEPCTPLAAPITITSRAYSDAQGRPRVDFSPALRFVPGREVVLYLRDKDAAGDSTAVIQWCGETGACITEAATQPSYETKRDQAVGIVYRAIKHFSGYMISSGRIDVAIE